MIRNIWAVGRNYSAHAKELGNDVPEKPLLFLKAGSTASFSKNEIILPTWPDWNVEIHHEVELALQFNEKFEITQVCLALDLTERKKQSELKLKGEPWTLAKSFKGACPLTPFFSIGSIHELNGKEILLKINKEIKQKGNTSQMIFSFDQLIQYVISYFPVCPGDLLLTGTPSGVGPIKKGDNIEVEFENKLIHDWIVR